MAGDVWQWNESLIATSLRGMRGGAYVFSSVNMQSSFRAHDTPLDEGSDIGFRLAMVPEPSSIVLALVGCVGGAIALASGSSSVCGR